MREVDRAHLDVLEPRPRSSALNSSSSANRKNGGPTGMSCGGLAPAAATASRSTPRTRARSGTSQTVSASRPLGTRTRANSSTTCSGPADMQHQEVGDHGIEGAVRERQCLRIAATELELRMESTCEREHPLGDVDADDRRTSSGCPGSHVTRSRGHVEDAVAAADLGCVEQRFDEPSRDGNEELVVPRDLRLPARCLERVERVRVDRGIGHGRNRTTVGWVASIPARGCA